MAHTGRNRRRLIRLWLEDCRCHWCEQPTVLLVAPPGGTGKVRHASSYPERATIDHLYSRLNGQRRQVVDGTETTVLVCYKCNQRRCREEQAALPLAELHQRSGRGNEAQ